MCENTDNPSLPCIYIRPARSYRAICVNSLSHIGATNMKDTGRVFIVTLNYSRYDSNKAVSPSMGHWGQHSGVAMPGLSILFTQV